MTNRTAWAPGNGVGLTFTDAFGSADLTSLPNGSGVLSSNSDIANGTLLDQFADVEVGLTISSTAIAAGSGIALYIFDLTDINGSTVYGDNSFPTPGTQAAFVAGGINPVDTISFRAATVTVMAGMAKRILLPPGPFRWALVNNTGVTLSATALNNSVKFRTYNQNLNA